MKDTIERHPEKQEWNELVKEDEDHVFPDIINVNEEEEHVEENVQEGVEDVEEVVPEDEHIRYRVVFQFFEKLQCQFLCGYPIEFIEWHNPFIHFIAHCGEVLTKILSKTVDSTYVHQVDKEYTLSFLERLIQELEMGERNNIDGIRSIYDIVKQQVTNGITEIYAYKYYIDTTEIQDVVLKEIRTSMAEASTGLHSGPASLALTDYLLHHKEIVKQCNIMELGAGTGLCGFMLKKCCDVGTVLLTDGSMECVELMKLNLRLNFPDYAEENEGEIQIKKLIWKEMETSNLVELVKPDILLAADVVFNDWEDLSCAVDFVFTSMKQATKMLLAATVNNEQTLDKFLQKLESLNFSIIDEPISEAYESILHWDRSTPIRILLITREDV